METVNDITPYLSSHLQQGDYVALTFFLTSIAMTAGAIFFFFQYFIVPNRWKNTTLVSGMILTIAALNYFYMRDYWVETQMSPTEFRYFDWLLTVPLICLEFYLLIRHLGVPSRKVYIMLFGSIWMLFWGYYGEALDRENAFTWGLVATLGAIVAFFEIGMGIRWVVNQPNKNLTRGYITMFALMVVFWNIYPIAYLTIPGNLLSNAMAPEALDVMYNLADIVNKVVFSMVFFVMIIYPSKDYQEAIYGGKVRKMSFDEYLLYQQNLRSNGAKEDRSASPRQKGNRVEA